MSKGIGDPNSISHIVRDIKKIMGRSTQLGEMICPVCNENLISMCEKCYASKVKRISSFYFPQEISEKVISTVNKF